MTTHPSSLSTFAMSAGEEPEPTVRTATGDKSEPAVCTAAVTVHTVHDFLAETRAIRWPSAGWHLALTTEFDADLVANVFGDLIGAPALYAGDVKLRGFANGHVVIIAAQHPPHRTATLA
jgi:hypothetical protein